MKTHKRKQRNETKRNKTKKLKAGDVLVRMKISGDGRRPKNPTTN